jgi:hypothetical protein
MAVAGGIGARGKCQDGECTRQEGSPQGRLRDNGIHGEPRVREKHRGLWRGVQGPGEIHACNR